MAYIGIDLGTTYCAASYFVDGQPEIIEFGGGMKTMPSVASVKVRKGKAKGKILIGWPAKNNQATSPQDTVLEAKRLMGTDEKVKIGAEEFSPIEISALFLKEIKRCAEEFLDEEVTGAVITCPAYFKNKARDATKTAGELAGLTVIQVMNEPTAAAHGYGYQSGGNEDGLFLVYDLGGGTFDVTVIEKNGPLLEVIGTGGDPNLGGGDFDDRIVEWMISHLKKEAGVNEYLEDKAKAEALRIRLKSYAEEAKKELCGPPRREKYEFSATRVMVIDAQPVNFAGVELTMKKFEELIMDLVKEKSLKWVETALEVPKKKNYSEEDIKAILLVGGSTRVPLVKKVLQDRFPNTEIRGAESGINPDEIVAIGASLIAAEKDPEGEEILESDLIDVTGHTLSVVSLDPERKLPILSAIIPKETPIPVKAAHQFSTVGPMQNQVGIQVYQGEHSQNELVEEAELANRVIRIGEFTLKIDEPSPDPVPIQIGLDLDDNGILVAYAKNLNNGKLIQCEISGVDKVSLNKEELKIKQKKLENILSEGIGGTIDPTLGESSPNPTKSSTVKNEAKISIPPIIKPLYDKMVNNFDKVPDDKKEEVWTLVNEIDKAVGKGDKSKLISFFSPLKQYVDSFGF